MLPGQGHCGTSVTSYLDTDHPATVGETVAARYCFDNVPGTVICWKEYVGEVTNCGTYFVYYLVNVDKCNLGYCGMEEE